MRISRDLNAAVETIRQGGLLVYPTEAVFGIGCNPAHSSAVQRLLAAKQRPAHKGLILLAANLNQLADYILPLDRDTLKLLEPTWPGPMTWLLPVRPEVSPLLRGNHDTLAVRISAHPVCQALCQKLGHPLVSTSANPADKEPAKDMEMVSRYFSGYIDLALDLPLGGLKKPTEIRDARTGTTLRQG